MKLNLLYIIVSLLLLEVLIYYLIFSCESKKESWVNYQKYPYGNIESGAGDNTRPIAFYDYPTYRQPLNWPVCHLVDYPVHHCRSNSL